MSSRPFRLRTFGAVGAVAALVALAACSSSGSSSGGASTSSSSGTVTVAVVSNPLVTGQMIPLTQSVFEKQNPGITVKFATYTEGDLRAAIEKDVSTHSNSFNVIMIGPYEAPLFAKNGWLDNLSAQYIASDPGYDASDILPSISKALAPVPGVDLEEYKRTLIERFANSQIRDTIARLCAESSDRSPKFLLPGDPGPAHGARRDQTFGRGGGQLGAIRRGY